MSPARSRRRVAAALVVPALLLGACGGGDDASPAASTTPVDVTATTGPTPTTSVAPPTSVGDGAADALADRPLLDAALPAGVTRRALRLPITLGDGSTTDATFEALEAGPVDGDLVLLLHGYPQTAFEWRAQLVALGDAGYHAVAVDQRGYSPGARPADDADYGILLLARDVLGFADVLGADRFHLVGHDWGAGVAWTVGLVAPERLLTLNPVSVPHPAAMAEMLADPDSEQSARSAYVATFQDPGSPARFTADGGTGFLSAALAGVATDDEVAVYAEVLGTEAAMSAALAWYRATDFGSGTDVPDVTVPTMFVWSDGDCCLGRDSAEATVDHVSGPYRFEVLEGVSHWVPEEAADELTALLLDHLATGA